MTTKEWIEIRTVDHRRFQSKVEAAVIALHPNDYTPFVMKPFNFEYEDEGLSWCDLFIDDFYNDREEYASWADIADAIWTKYRGCAMEKRRVIYA